MEQVAFSWEPERRILSVSEFTGELAALLAGEFDDIWITGELSGCKLSGAGLQYAQNAISNYQMLYGKTWPYPGP